VHFIKIKIMYENNLTNLDELINPFLYSVTELSILWSKLTIESQIIIFKSFIKNNKEQSLLEDFINLTLDSKNEYVRYLAAIECIKDEKLYEAFYNKISSDSADIVNNLLILKDIKYHSPENFFLLSQKYRLTILNIYKFHYDLNSLIEFALKNNVKKNELIELIVSYINNKEFKNYYSTTENYLDGFEWYMKTNYLTEIWKTMPKLPKDIANIFLAYLPVETMKSKFIPDNWSMCLPDDILYNLSDDQCIILLERTDINLPKNFIEKKIKELEEKELFIKEKAIRKLNFEEIKFLSDEELSQEINNTLQHVNISNIQKKNTYLIVLTYLSLSRPLTKISKYFKNLNEGLTLIMFYVALIVVGLLINKIFNWFFS